MDNSINEAVEVLRKGGLILYPTDTVWGIGCDATNEQAVAKVFALKKRDDAKALVLLASDLDMIARYIKEIPQIAIDLVEVNDAPMTIIYPGAVCSESGKSHRGALAPNAVAEDGSVGIRIPLTDNCLELVKRLGRPLVSTSANISGEPTPKNFAQIGEEIKQGVDFVVNPELEKQSLGKASQIIKVGLDSQVKIIRG